MTITCDTMEGLFEVTQLAGEGRFSVRLDGDHPIFEGHFPDNPVLPGVCTLAIVRRCVSLMTGESLRYGAIAESKFLAAITPVMTLTVDLAMGAEQSDGQPITAVVRSGPTVMLKLKATLVRDE